MNVIFNPLYMLKPDNGRVLILHRGGLRPVEDQHDDSFSGYIHPLHAKILASLDGIRPLEETLKKLSQTLGIEEIRLRHFINILLKSKSSTGFWFKDSFISFPGETLIYSNSTRDITYPDLDVFSFKELNLRQRRHSSVSKLTLMLTNICQTKCYYCYADKRRLTMSSVPLQKYLDIIKEAHASYVSSIDLIGGEVFLYPYWQEIVKKLTEYHYRPLLSTKMPIEEGIISFLSEMDLPLQLSLDSGNPSTLSNMLNVSEHYLSEIAKSLQSAIRHNVKIAIHTVLTQKNASFADISALHNFLKQYSKIILYWRLDLGSASMYVKENVKKTIAPDEDSIKDIYEYGHRIASVSDFPILLNGIEPASNEAQHTSITEYLRNKAICTGNYSQLFILPDGKVTICEELYWHPRFIIGDVLSQSLYEIWNSPAATTLYNISQSELSDNSACKKCDLFNDCRSLKQICYRDTIQMYGFDNWDYPDVKCPKAPLSTSDFVNR